MFTCRQRVAHLAARSETDALNLVRRVLSYLPSNNVENPPFLQPHDDPLRMDEHLNHIVPWTLPALHHASSHRKRSGPGFIH